jgi:hypothetical protein
MAEIQATSWEMELAKFFRALTELVKIGTEALKKEMERKESR